MNAWLAGTALAVLGGCGGSSDEQPAPVLRNNGDSGGFVEEIYHFRDLPQMTASSDLVVEGTVTSVGPGRIVGGTARQRERIEERGPDAESKAVPGETLLEASGAIQFNDVSLSVDQVLYDPLSAVPDKLVLDEEARHSFPSRVGDHGVYFLQRQAEDPNRFIAINSQSRFLAATDGAVAGSNDDATWVQELERLSLDQLLARVEAAVERVEAGEVEPAPSKLD